ncbi:hypothetical protein PWR66_07680 [Paraburkholderia sp. A1RO-5]|uniref:hypothetical protein n=1 Tax=Paraburkholderia sp. A1RO-5 TaxID=3028369 RepID=UPI003B820402
MSTVEMEMPGGLDALAGVVAETDAGAAAVLMPGAVPGAQPDMPQGPDYGRGAAGMVELVRGMVDGFAPGAGWDNATNERMAASLAPVFEKYGWDVERALPCELVALMVCGPVLYQSARVVALKIQTDRAAQLRAARGITDPNTIAGAAAAQSGSPAGPQGAGQPTAAETLARAMADVPQFPDM